MHHVLPPLFLHCDNLAKANMHASRSLEMWKYRKSFLKSLIIIRYQNFGVFWKVETKPVLFRSDQTASSDLFLHENTNVSQISSSFFEIQLRKCADFQIFHLRKSRNNKYREMSYLYFVYPVVNFTQTELFWIRVKNRNSTVFWKPCARSVIARAVIGTPTGNAQSFLILREVWN